MILAKKGSATKIAVSVGVSAMLLFSNTAMASAQSVLKVGSEGKEVSKLQERLKELGFYKYSKITGYYGSITKDAVIRFQKDRGLAADGIVGSKTFAALSQSSSSSSSQILKRGDRGEAVKEIQRALKEKGYYSYSIDGDFGARTEKAVKEFQKDAGIHIDGIVGKVTAAKLKESSSSRGSDRENGDKKSSSSVIKRGDRGEAVSNVQKLLKQKGYYSSAVDGIFGPATESAVKKFQKAAGITVDGIVGKVTMSKLTSSSSPSNNDKTDSGSSRGDSRGGIQMLAWSQVDKLFKRGETARVIDVDTGKSFKIYRYGGHLHADVEPLTAEDTAIMKKIYGGKWSWARRAIVVEVDGYRIAASMNGMPHGGQAISGNNFDGQFCIHFLNSRTHGSDRVDPDHQAAIKKAAKSNI